MRCEEVRARVTAYVDDELDPVMGARLAEHIQTCPTCALLEGAERNVRATVARHGTYHRAPLALRARVFAALDEAPAGRAARPAAEAAAGRASEPTAEPPAAAARARGRRSFLDGLFDLRLLAAATSAAALVLVAASLVPALRRVPAPAPAARAAEEALAGAVLDAHIRSLMADHLTDVASTDQHTVKPWFNGKLDFSPPVEELSTSGYPLIGGRLDYLGGRPVAALVYQRRKHFINVFLRPSASSATADAAPYTRQGYHMFHGARRGMDYWVVSDLNPSELREFVRLLEGGAAPAIPPRAPAVPR